jgi:hypothetical protein
LWNAGPSTAFRLPSRERISGGRVGNNAIFWSLHLATAVVLLEARVPWQDESLYPLSLFIKELLTLKIQSWIYTGTTS